MKCWEFMKCVTSVRTSCPAYPDNGLNCWKVTGTICDGGKMRMANLSEKIIHCRQCDFYRNYATKY